MFKQVKGNAWDLIQSGDYDGLCITTNGTITKAGKCVMGRGIALEAKQRIFGLDTLLGDMLSHHGNQVMLLGHFKDKSALISFPVKHNWLEVADIELIHSSAIQLMKLIDKHELKSVLLPRPGCGNGKLMWEEVSPIIAEVLDERVVIVSF